MKTSLYNHHVKLDSKIVDFAGFDMPVSYPAGINKESAAVRENVGVFDVSHMGQILIKGNNAFKFVQYLTTNDIALLKKGDCQYTLMCNQDGGIIDDLILYCLDDGYLLVVNASNIDKDFNWIESHVMDDVSIENLSDNTSLIALQGPNSRRTLSELEGFENILSDLKFYKFRKYNNSQTGIVSRTGYTGELGYEIYGEHDFINDLWSKLTLEYGVQPVGLAARDILRLEMCYRLYGNDMNEEISPFECGLNWVVSKKANHFIGKDAIIERKKTMNRKIVYLEMKDRCIPRKGYRLISEERDVGYICSGTFSPNLKQGIAMAFVDIDQIKINNIYVKIRDKMFLTNIVNNSFLMGTSLFE